MAYNLSRQIPRTRNARRWHLVGLAAERAAGPPRWGVFDPFEPDYPLPIVENIRGMPSPLSDKQRQKMVEKLLQANALLERLCR